MPFCAEKKNFKTIISVISQLIKEAKEEKKTLQQYG